jgi:sulfur carrier protein
VRIRLNGEWQSVRDGVTVAELLAELGLENRRIAVEVNCHVVPRRDHAAHRLRDGDEVEVVHFVGGG